MCRSKSRKPIVRVTAFGLAVGTLFVALGVMGGCTSFSDQRKAFMSHLTRGEYSRAEKALGDPKKVRKEDRVNDALDRGMVLHLERRFAESDKWFEAAERRIDELFTESISDKVAAVFWNDSAKPYAGEEFERVALNIVRGGGYLNRGMKESAAVEFRKVSSKLQVYTDRLSGLGMRMRYRDDGFAHYLAALAAESVGETERALVSFRKALPAYEQMKEQFGIDVPRELVADLLRVLPEAGLDDEAARIADAYDGVVAAPSLGDDAGELVVLAGIGHVAYKISKKWMAPDPQGDVIAVTYPEFTRRTFQAAGVDVTLFPLPGDSVHDGDKPTGPAVKARIRREVVTDLSAIAIAVLGDRNVDVKDEAIARAIASYIAKKAGRAMTKSDNNAVKALGALINIGANVRDIVEVADTRSWLSLPDRYEMIRIRLKPGRYRIDPQTRDGGGRVMYKMPSRTIRIDPGKRVFRVFHTFG